MGRIVVEAMIENGIAATFRIQNEALIDTGAAYLTSPLAWRDRLSALRRLDTVSVETATRPWCEATSMDWCYSAWETSGRY